MPLHRQGCGKVIHKVVHDSLLFEQLLVLVVDLAGSSQPMCYLRLAVECRTV